MYKMIRSAASCYRGWLPRCLDRKTRCDLLRGAVFAGISVRLYVGESPTTLSFLMCCYKEKAAELQVDHRMIIIEVSL